MPFILTTRLFGKKEATSLFCIYRFGKRFRNSKKNRTSQKSKYDFATGPQEIQIYGSRLWHATNIFDRFLDKHKLKQTSTGLNLPQSFLHGRTRPMCIESGSNISQFESHEMLWSTILKELKFADRRILRSLKLREIVKGGSWLAARKCQTIFFSFFFGKGDLFFR